MFTQKPEFITDELRERYADQLIALGGNETNAALAAMGKGDEALGDAMNVVNWFKQDRSFQTYYMQRIAEAPELIVPHKQALAFELLAFARDARLRQDETGKTKLEDHEFALRAYRLFCEIMGYIQKGGDINLNVNNQTLINKVMIIPPEESLETWTKRTAEQQRVLIHDATAS